MAKIYGLPKISADYSHGGQAKRRTEPSFYDISATSLRRKSTKIIQRHINYLINKTAVLGQFVGKDETVGCCRCAVQIIWAAFCAAFVPLRTVGFGWQPPLFSKHSGLMTPVLRNRNNNLSSGNGIFFPIPAGGPDRAAGPKGIKEGLGGPAREEQSAQIREAWIAIVGR